VKVYEKNQPGGKNKDDIISEIENRKLLATDSQTSSLFEKVEYFFEDDFRFCKFCYVLQLF